ncbi:DUF4843 domain-containing protein [Carboxylicivirga taeanensis]|uniref:DUF4843 domain-containing protein n=1 Tax=Carboxylicivirga taeanensis TaxID=1416875 RepID=UPI003F6DE140
MKKTLIQLCLIILTIYGCSQNERLQYDEKPGVYFADYDQNSDSLVYSFTTTPNAIDTINLRVKILGSATKDLVYKINVSSESTAQEGVHYVGLNDTHTFPAGKSSTNLPLILTKSADLEDSMVTLSLELVGTDDMDVGYLDKSSVRIFLTDQLIKPQYWDSKFQRYFGEYSKVKHQLCIDIMGHDFPLTYQETRGWGGYSAYSYWMYVGREAAKYIATNDVYDENGKLIPLWEPY